MIYLMANRGDFPRPIRLTRHCLGWPQEAVEKWLSDRAAEGYEPTRRPPEVVAKAVQQRSANRAARKAAQQEAA